MIDRRGVMRIEINPLRQRIEVHVFEDSLSQRIAMGFPLLAGADHERLRLRQLLEILDYCLGRLIGAVQGRRVAGEPEIAASDDRKRRQQAADHVPNYSRGQKHLFSPSDFHCEWGLSTYEALPEVYQEAAAVANPRLGPPTAPRFLSPKLCAKTRL